MNSPATISVRNQAEANALIPPALANGPVHLEIRDMEGRIDLLNLGILSVTVSGGDAPIHPDWVRRIRDDCEAAGVPFTLESWGEWQNGSHKEYETHIVLLDGRHGKTPHDLGWSPSQYNASKKWHDQNPTMMARVGRERSGRTLDGVVHEGGDAR